MPFRSAAQQYVGTEKDATGKAYNTQSMLQTAAHCHNEYFQRTTIQI